MATYFRMYVRYRIQEGLHGVSSAVRAVPEMIAADVEQLKRLLGSERRALVEFLVALERFDRLKLYEPLGHPGLWPFLQRELGLLKCATYQRFWGCRLIRDYPSAIERLREGSLALSTFVMLRDVLTPANAERMFDEIRGKSRDEVKKLVEEVSGQTAEPQGHGRTYTIRKAPLPAAVVASPAVAALRALTSGANVPPTTRAISSADAHRPTSAAGPMSAGPISAGPIAAGPMSAAGAAPAARDAEASANQNSPPAETMVTGSVGRSEPELIIPNRSRPTEISPTAGGFYDVAMRVRERFVELLKRAALAESHVVPDGDPEMILTRGLELILEKYEKKIGKVPVRETGRRNKSSDSNTNPDSGYISAELRRKILERDGFKCVWPMADGSICGSERGLECDHVTPLGKGGKTEEGNLRAVCHEHNQQAAREAFGSEHIARAIAESRMQREKNRA